jgi:hypothetical protein
MKAPISSETSVTVYRSQCRDIPEHFNLATRKLYTKGDWTHKRRIRSRLGKSHIGGDIVLMYLSACQLRYRFGVWFGFNWLYVHSTEDRGNGSVLSYSFNLGARWIRVENFKTRLFYRLGKS